MKKYIVKETQTKDGSFREMCFKTLEDAEAYMAKRMDEIVSSSSAVWNGWQKTKDELSYYELELAWDNTSNHVRLWIETLEV